MGAAAAGVVAIVASPFFGAVGAVTVVGAAVGATVGGVLGALAPDGNAKEVVAAAEKRGHAQAKAEHASEVQDLKSKYDQLTKHMTIHFKHVDLMLALFGIGMACAAHSGTVDEDTLANLKEIVAGLANEAMPADVQDKFAQLQANPPTLKSAFARAQSVAADSMQVFDDMVAIVAAMQGGVVEQEVTATWAQLRAA